MTIINTHMTAIQTKYLGPTDFRGSRIKVWRADGFAGDDPDSMTVSWDYALDSGENHVAAIEQYLARKAERGHDWCQFGHWVAGGARYGWYAVFVSDKEV